MNATQTHKHAWLLIAISLLFVSLSGWANTLDYTKTKEYNETFAAGANDLLRLDNRYGNITITHWSKAEVSIRVVVESKAGNEKRAQEGLDRVEVALKKSGNAISGITSLRNQTGWNNDNNRLTINYFVSIPADLAINISQKYGNVNLPNSNKGRAALEVKYGNINAGSFTSPLTIDAGYSNVHLDDVENVHMDLSYCGKVSIGNAKDVRIDSKYSNLVCKDVTTLSMDKKYGNLSARKVEKAQISVKYSELSIDYLKSELSVSSLDYSTLKVKELNSDFQKVDVSARYGNLQLSISSQAAFKVNAERMKYGNADVKGLTITDSTQENKENYYYKINGGGSRTIQFNGNSYSNIKVQGL